MQLGKMLTPSNAQRSPLAQSASPAHPTPAAFMPAGSHVRLGPQLPVLHSGPISQLAPASSLPIGASHMPSAHRMPTRHGVLTVHASPTLPPTIAGPVGEVDEPLSSPLVAPTPMPKLPQESGHAHTSQAKARVVGLMRAEDRRPRRAVPRVFSRGRIRVCARAVAGPDFKSLGANRELSPRRARRA